uniref:Transmembrane protein n=1 Tax=Streptomyces sp. NBC_00003 TaxID=2903608 RepID=A0AAU2VES4_9ACTN
MRAITGVWRWRHNPLRRRTDFAEAWVALVALVLMVFAAPAVGVLCGALTDASLRQAVTEQRRHRHVTSAVVVRRAEQRAPVAEPDGSMDRSPRTRVVANWTAYDGSSHSGTLASPLKAPAPGASFPIWTDDHGRPTPRPMALSAADTHAVFSGICAAAAAAGLVEGVRRLIVWRLIRRRYERLDRAWARYGPDWGRTGAGS